MHRFLFYIAIVSILSFACQRAQGEIIAYWNFDGDFGATAGGPSFDLTAVNGAAAGVSGGRFGSAASFSRAASQYAFTGGNVLAANSDFSYSAWFNFTGGDITGTNRFFVLETTAGDTPSATGAWTASLGLRDSSGTDIAEFFTHPSLAFGNSPFVANQWNNAIVTYDADGGTNANTGIMRAFINGDLIATYNNVPSTTAVGGLVIGGHRAGTGRNFEGLIDDVAFFSHVLTPTQISNLQAMNAAQAMAVPEPSSLVIAVLCSGVAVIRHRQRSTRRPDASPLNPLA
jgi:hypothetical protein